MIKKCAYCQCEFDPKEKIGRLKLEARVSKKNGIRSLWFCNIECLKLKVNTI